MKWYIFGEIAHYVERLTDPLCRATLCAKRIAQGVERPWDVAQDIGKIGLCEECKRRIRES